MITPLFYISQSIEQEERLQRQGDKLTKDSLKELLEKYNYKFICEDDGWQVYFINCFTTLVRDFLILGVANFTASINPGENLNGASVRIYIKDLSIYKKDLLEQDLKEGRKFNRISVASVFY